MKQNYLCMLAVTATLIWSACGSKQQKAAPPSATQVSIIEARKTPAFYYDNFQGIVISLNTVELFSQVSGTVTGKFFLQGEIVKKGKPLYEIDPRKHLAAYQQAQANVVNAKASLVLAKKDMDRYSMLLKNDAIARQTFDQASATYETAKSQLAVANAGLEMARADLSYTIIVAPFTGRIGISQVSVGDLVTPGTTLLNTISDEDPIGVQVVINEQQLDRFYKLMNSSTGSTFKLQLSNSRMYGSKGKILAVDRGVNNQTGSIIVRVQFPNPNKELKDGMSGVLQVLNNDSGDRIQIPYKAVVEQMGEFFVFTAQDSIALQHKVTLGPRVNANVIVLNGINEGDKVITEGIQRLRDSSKVTAAGK
ncbi:efflux RND transporter periplasmic adaptor subunit [Mucilaginibacter sp. JRF]|uniref:efflux RND transporter periplasmic adaptor subunit n=1 Tax=Mucilaginibacter sp. JRF TaxID=2780088 RepID=UPI00188049BA|nr:efflux RND transporter periplasmic adaptor subunit [Mucilaginibacter sp. JRF]MBE9583287.1 efflux RND transporter periplasmic adaptor subunit [Mucilaginibacter sp. JRF]